MVSFPMKVSFVWPFPISSKRITSCTPSMASCSTPYCAGSTLFPSSRKSTSRKRSSPAEQSHGTHHHSGSPAHPVLSCSREIFLPREKSILHKGAVKPFGPHHCITYFGSVHAFQTNSRGASKTSARRCPRAESGYRLRNSPITTANDGLAMML